MATLYTVAVGEMCPRLASIVDRIVNRFFATSGRDVHLGLGSDIRQYLRMRMRQCRSSESLGGIFARTKRKEQAKGRGLGVDAVLVGQKNGCRARQPYQM